MNFFTPDDPKWTAYVLGELDQNERAAVEAELEVSAEARALVEEIRSTTEFMKDELAKEAVRVLTPEQRDVVQAGSRFARKSWFHPNPTTAKAWAAAGLAAACLVLAIVAPSMMRSRKAGETGAVEEAINSLKNSVSKTADSSPAGEAAAQNSAKAEIESKTKKNPNGLRYQPWTGASAVDDAALLRSLAPAQTGRAEAAPQVTPRVGMVGAIRGVVQDKSQAAMPGITVTATNTLTNVSQAMQSNESGGFSFSALPAGKYKLSGVLKGFKTAIVPEIEVTNIPLQFDLTMEVGSQVDSFIVQADTSQALRSTSATVGDVLPEYRVRELPMVTNDVLDLVRLLPGYQAGTGQGQGQREVDRIGGLDLNSVNTTVNGLSVTEGRWANTLNNNGIDSNSRERLSRELSSEFGVNLAPTDTKAGQPIMELAKAMPAAAPGAPTVVPGIPPASTPATAAAPDRPVTPTANTALYDVIVDNPFLSTASVQNQLSTFSADVDTASYSNIRRFLRRGQLPPRNAVRIEEMINYFTYDYAKPVGVNPIGATLETAAAPWSPQHRIVRIAIKARDIEASRKPPSNLVFLVDVSGSMSPTERLPLLKTSLRMLVEKLTANDHVTIVTYAGTTGLALPPTRGDQKDTIIGVINSLSAGGSTNGASGIQLAYSEALRNFNRDGVNRVILATDGDFNVGVTDRGELLRIVEARAKEGVFLTVLGVGTDNLKDGTLEALADKGNGNYAYLDTAAEAQKVLVDQMTGTLVTVAKDVKLQIEFNPALVSAYRLIGYENRSLRNEDFNDDRKDAGDMGAGHTVTALYEVVPRGVAAEVQGVDALRYQRAAAATATLARNDVANEMLVVKIRYKDPDGSESKLLEFPLVDREGSFAKASTDLRFAAAVASYGMILRDSPYKGTSSLDTVLGILEDSLGADPNGYRREFRDLVLETRRLR